MNVLLVNTNRMRPPIGPLGLDYIGAALEQRGHEVTLLDFTWSQDDRAAAAETLDAGNYDLVACSYRNSDDCYYVSKSTFTEQLNADVALLRELYAGPIAIGGCGFSVLPVPLLEACGADYGVVGDGETALPALLDVLAGRLEPASAPGLVFRCHGDWVQDPRAEADVGALPLSRRALVDNRRYFVEGGQAGIETKRGCAWNCSYCLEPMIKGRTRLRPPADVVAEIRSLLAQGVDVFHTCDSEFNLPPEHAAAVCRAIIDAGLGGQIRWYTYMTPHPVGAELVDLLRRAGCVGIDFGVDSGCEEMLAGLGRPYGVDAIVDTAQLCRKAGIVFMFDLLIGAPGETDASTDATLEMVDRAGPDCVGVSAGVRVYPGTRLAAQLLETGEVQDVDALEPVYYVAPELGGDPYEIMRARVGSDPRFFLPAGDDEQNYNYNDNDPLQQAIANGARGAYWDILRQARMRGD